MKVKALSAAIAALSLGGFSQASFALAPSATINLELNISGASAQDNNVENLVKTKVCQAGTFDKYQYTTTASDYMAYTCTVNRTNVTGLTGTGAVNVLIRKRANGGSSQGVVPLLSNLPISQLAIIASGAGACTSAGTNLYNCPTLTTKSSDLGISDVNPELFVGVNTETDNGFAAVDPAQVKSKLTVTPAAALVFGVPVSYNLYKALQIAQGLTAGGACTATVANPNADYTEACLPSLTKSQISGLVSGNISTWDQFTLFDSSTSSYVPLTSFPGVTAPDDNLVHFCKRIGGSGTGAQQYAKFLNTPCTENGLPVASNADTGPQVTDLSGSGDMEKCLDDFSKGTQTAKNYKSPTSVFFDPSQPNDNYLIVNQGAAKSWAFGQQSLEKNLPVASNGNKLAFDYRFIKIDGYAPTLANVFAGKYIDFAESTWQYPKTGLSNDKKTLATYLIKNAATPAVLGAFDVAKANQTFGVSGYLAVAPNTWSDSLDVNNPVLPYTHAANGVLDNCSIPAVPNGSGVVPFK